MYPKISERKKKERIREKSRNLLNTDLSGILKTEHQTVIFNTSSTLVKVKTIFTANESCFLLASAVQIFYNDAAKKISLQSGYQIFASENVDGESNVVGLFFLKKGESVDLYAASKVGGVGTNPIIYSILKFNV